MAELVDALDSGSSVRKGMGVRVPLSAPRVELVFRFNHIKHVWVYPNLTLFTATGL